jgi:two-component system chemotaxis response regulator CheB
MPPTFTTILATHISKATGGICREAQNGELVSPGVIYIAPGDYHMTALREGTSVKLKLDQNPQENFCRPAADPMLRSLAKVYGSQLLTAILTGIGADGTRGAAEVVAAGGTVVGQDEATSVVYGMPRAAAEAKLLSAVLPLPEMGPYLLRAVS